MKIQYKRFLTVLCAIILVINVGYASAKYVTNISTELPIMVQAAGYTLICHLEGGAIDGNEGPWIKTQYGDKTFEPPKEVDPNGTANVEFLGWAYDKDAREVDVEKGDPVTVTEQITRMYAIWGFHMEYETNYENGIGDLTAIDENNMVVDITTNNATYERIFIPLTGLDPNSVYRISFDYSGSGEYHHYTRDNGGRGFFGYHVINETDKNEYKKNVEPLRYNPTGFNHFIDNNASDQKFSFQDVHHSDIFVADGDTMYLYLEYSDVKDYTLSYHYITNLEIEKLNTDEYSSTIKHIGGSNIIAYDKHIYYEDGYYSFKMTSNTGMYERFGFEIPMTLEVGSEYTVSFDFKNNATDGKYANGYFGYAVSADSSCLDTYQAKQYDGTFTDIAIGGAGSYSHTFAATNETMYMLYEISRAQDEKVAKYEITNFNIEKTGETYDQWPEGYTLPTIDLDYTSIDENLGWWPVENELVYDAFGYDIVNAQYPYAGFDYTLAFESVDQKRWALPEIITVSIDDTVYHVDTTTAAWNDGTEPTFDPEKGTLTIPAALLTPLTETISIEAAAVPKVIEPILLDTTGIDETIAWSVLENELVYEELGFTDINAQQPYADYDYSIALAPQEPDNWTLPEVITVRIDDAQYDVYTDGMEHRQTPADGAELPPMPLYYTDSSILFIPAELLTDTVQTLAITAAAVPVEEPVLPILLDDSEIDPRIGWHPVENEKVYAELGYTDVDARMPYAGFDYAVAFAEIPEGFTLSANISVDIEGTVYTVAADGSANGPSVPSFDPTTRVLTIPADLLTDAVTFVAIAVDAVPVITETEETDAEPESEADAETEAETKADAETEPESETEAETEPETEFETEAETEPEVKEQVPAIPEAGGQEGAEDTSADVTDPAPADTIPETEVKEELPQPETTPEEPTPEPDTEAPAAEAEPVPEQLPETFSEPEIAA